MVQKEYLVIDLGAEKAKDIFQFEALLNDIGADGWEATPLQFNGASIFQRDRAISAEERKKSVVVERLRKRREFTKKVTAKKAVAPVVQKKP